MRIAESLRTYAASAFRWQKGRQGTGYDKMLLLTLRWPLRFDSYLIRYPEGSEIPPHRDPVQQGRHYRLNIILKPPKSGGEFICAKPLFSTKRIKSVQRTVNGVPRSAVFCKALPPLSAAYLQREASHKPVTRTLT